MELASGYSSTLLSNLGLLRITRGRSGYLGSQVSCMRYPNINRILTASGCGKSVMARFLADIATTSVTLTHFFQDSVDRNSSRATSLVVSMLSQILKSKIPGTNSDFESAFASIVPLLDQFSSGQDCPFLHLWPVLEAILFNMHDYTLIVDALDECDDPANNDPLIERLRLLGSMANSRVILLSRFHARFEGPLQEAVQLAMDSSTVGADILHFVRQEISRNTRLQPLQSEILAKAEDSSQGMFLWAKLMLDDLSHSRSIDIQLQRLAGFPRGLNNIYTEYLHKGTLTMYPEDIALRREIFTVLVGALRPLTVDEMSCAIALKPSRQLDESELLFDPKQEILRLCWPLAIVAGDFVQLTHKSVKDYLLAPSDQAMKMQGRLNLTVKESNTYLPRKCLSKLSQEECGSLHRIGAMIRKNAFPSTAEGIERSKSYKTTAFFEYAALNWHLHLISVPDPKLADIDRLREFLQSNCFVYWAEALYELKSHGDVGPALDVRASIQAWLALRPARFREIALSYFCAAYESVRQQYQDAKELDETLSFLCLFRLGEYENLGEYPDESYKIYQLLAQDLKDRFGAENPMTMKANYHLGIELMTQGQMLDAERLLSINKKMQYRVLGPDHPDSVLSLEYLGFTQWYLNRLEESTQSQAEAQAGLQRLWGPVTKEVLKSQLFLGYALQSQRKLDEALEIFEGIWNIWLPVMGPSNPLSLMAQCSMGAIHRKRRVYEKAKQHLTENLAERLRVFSLNAAVTIDSGLQLALLYRETRCTEEAEALLDLIAFSGVVEQWFERVCQVSHIRALLCMDRGNPGEATEMLRDILTVASSQGREANNRELLWVRLTLADLLRSQDRDDEALFLFSDMVRHQGVDANDSRLLAADFDSRPQLRTAEQGLRLIRAAEIGAAENLLEENGLEWVRPQDFWIIFGGEMTDTAWINDPSTRTG